MFDFLGPNSYAAASRIFLEDKEKMKNIVTIPLFVILSACTAPTEAEYLRSSAKTILMEQLDLFQERVTEAKTSTTHLRLSEEWTKISTPAQTDSIARTNSATPSGSATIHIHGEYKYSTCYIDATISFIDWSPDTNFLRKVTGDVVFYENGQDTSCNDVEDFFGCGKFLTENQETFEFDEDAACASY